MTNNELATTCLYVMKRDKLIFFFSDTNLILTCSASQLSCLVLGYVKLHEHTSSMSALKTVKSKVLRKQKTFY